MPVSEGKASEGMGPGPNDARRAKSRSYEGRRPGQLTSAAGGASEPRARGWLVRRVRGPEVGSLKASAEPGAHYTAWFAGGVSGLPPPRKAVIIKAKTIQNTLRATWTGGR